MYVFNIPLVIFPPTCLLQLEYDWWNYHCYMIICRNTWSRKVVCSTIQGWATNKSYYYINVACIQIVPHWGTNRECGINRGNMVCASWYSSYHLAWVVILKRLNGNCTQRFYMHFSVHAYLNNVIKMVNVYGILKLHDACYSIAKYGRFKYNICSFTSLDPQKY